MKDEARSVSGLAHWESTPSLVLTFLMWARHDCTADRPSVSSEEVPESSWNVGLDHMAADDRIWGHIVDRDEEEYLGTWASSALGESCYSYAKTWYELDGRGTK